MVLVKYNKILWMLILFAIFQKMFFLLQFSEEGLLEKDAGLYYNISTNLLIRGEFAADLDQENFGNPIKDNIYAIKSEKTAQVPPGYPIFLSILRKTFGNKFIYILFCQIIIEFIAVIFFLYTLKRNKINNAVIIIYLLLYSIYSPFTKYSLFILSDSLFTSILLIYISYLLRVKRVQPFRSVLLGILAGIVSLIRPTPLPVFILLPIIYYLLKFRAKTIKWFGNNYLLYIFCLFLTLTPWIIRNYQLYNKFIFSSTLGGLAFEFTTAERIGGMTGNFLPKVRETEKLKEYFNNHNINVKKESLNEAELDYYFRRIGIEQLKQNPKNYLANISINFFRFWFNLPFKGASIGSYMLAAFNFILIGIIVFNIRILVKNKFTLIFFIPIIYFSIVHTFIGNTSARYNIPIMPLVLFLAAYSLDLILLKYREQFMDRKNI